MSPTPSSGIIVVDKPAGITSAQLVARLKTLFSANKAGHTGTLDPFATGVMVCCINRATRLAGLFLHGDKTYRAALHLGIETDTMDVTGTVLRRTEIQWNHPPPDFTDSGIERIFKRFEGPMEQLPPVYSALKHQGVPLYKLARQGRPVQKPARSIEIFTIRITEICLPIIRFEVSCSAGTYIRSLCSDIGKAFGCGAYLKELRRTQSCGFSIDEAYHPDALETLAADRQLQSTLIGMGDALREIPGFICDSSLLDKIVHGKPLYMHDFNHTLETPPDGFMKLLDPKARLLAVIRFDFTRKRFAYHGVFANDQAS